MSEILDLMRADEKLWKEQLRQYQRYSRFLRLTIIVGSAIEVAQESIRAALNHQFPWVMPAIALTVGICASLEAWMKPGEKREGTRRDCDELDELILQWSDTASAGQSMDKIKEAFFKLRQQHRQNEF
jgi:hypothetical protein